MNPNKLSYYVGSQNQKGKAMAIFHPQVCDFLSELSIGLMKDPVVKAYPDIVTFAFWIRKANIQKYKTNYSGQSLRLGKGMVFHIAPSNIPINFAFSLVFGLLAGNANVVRVSSKEFVQTEIVCNHIKKVLAGGKYPQVSENITIISYDHDQEITDHFSRHCDIRVIWGGDATIAEIRKSTLPPRATEITFADRYSFSLIEAGAILSAGEKDLKQLAEAFFNDTYLIDQNACSSPHLLVWKNSGLTQPELKAAQDKFWTNICQVAGKWEIKDIHASEKYLLACKYSVLYEEVKQLHTYTNRLYVMDLEKITERLTAIRGKFGLFSQCVITDYAELLPLLKKNTQTITYYGIKAQQLAETLAEYGISGVDRIVPFGGSLELDLIWDGYDLMASLSRVLDYK